MLPVPLLRLLPRSRPTGCFSSKTGALSLAPRRDTLQCSGQQLLMVWKIKITDGGEPGPQTASKLALSSGPPLPPSIPPLLPPLPRCKAKTPGRRSRAQTNYGWVGGSKKKQMALQQLSELVLRSHPGGAEDSAYVAARPLPAASSSVPRPDGPGAAATVPSVGRRNQALVP